MTSAEPKAHIHDHSLSWLGLGTSVTYRYDSVKLVLWAQTSPFSEIMPVYKNKTNGKVALSPTCWKERRMLPWPWSYGSGIYNYLCNQCLSPLMWVRISIRARCTTLFSGYSGFLNHKTKPRTRKLICCSLKYLGQNVMT
jgi:hypothetical protein